VTVATLPGSPVAAPSQAKPEPNCKTENSSRQGSSKNAGFRLVSLVAALFALHAAAAMPQIDENPFAALLCSKP